MALKRKKPKLDETTYNVPKVNRQFTSSGYTKHCFIGCALLIIIVLWSIITKNDNTAQSLDVITKKTPSKKQIEIIQRYSYEGDLNSLKQFVNNNRRMNWTYIQYSSSSTNTLIHLALQGRHDSINRSPMSLRGHHEDVIDYLIHELKWNTSRGCPIYHALHYRNFKALQLLLNSSANEESVYCLTTTDLLGLTALHVAAKCKASGFARFYSKLFDKNGFVKNLPIDVTLLLGLSLKVPLQNTADILTMTALNDAILHNDILIILKHVVDSDTKLSQLLDADNNTLLHVAARAGRTKLVETLMEHVNDNNDNPNTENVYGQTPRHLAIANGHTHIANMFQLNNNNVDNNRDDRGPVDGRATIDRIAISEYEKLNWDKYLNSGWNNDQPSLDDLNSSYPLCSQVLPIVKELNKEIMNGYQTPLLIYSAQNMNKEWTAWKNWRRSDIVKRYGEVEFDISSIPYEDLYYTEPKKITRITLREYIDTFNSTIEHPLYLFDGKSLNQLPKLSSDFIIPEWLDSTSIYLKQFILGGRNSGSPPHFHGHAVNTLMYGVKDWYFWKPSESFFAFMHVMEWKKQNYSDPFIRCLQLPGDMMYIPDNWGHAVINVQDSVGIALEFW